MAKEKVESEKRRRRHNDRQKSQDWARENQFFRSVISEISVFYQWLVLKLIKDNGVLKDKAHAFLHENINLRGRLSRYERERIMQAEELAQAQDDLRESNRLAKERKDTSRTFMFLAYILLACLVALMYFHARHLQGHEEQAAKSAVQTTLQPDQSPANQLGKEIEQIRFFIKDPDMLNLTQREMRIDLTTPFGIKIHGRIIIPRAVKYKG
ncbi:MAG: hypothetical protein NTZ80_02670 [Patescibacteria group bacterium]|nr:hypothetical protein [Patescibacteria group bacterium]